MKPSSLLQTLSGVQLPYTYLSIAIGKKVIFKNKIAVILTSSLMSVSIKKQ